MSRHLFTSDLHLGHPKVAALRGYDDPADHDRTVLGALSDVGDADVLWILGDLVGTAREWPYALAELARLPGRKRLVLGNHDPAHPMNRNAYRHTAELAAVFEWWGTCARSKVCGHPVVLSHFPYWRDRGAPRHLQWRLPNEDAWLLHGHTHGTERVTTQEVGRIWRDDPNVREYRDREVHVGWDAWHRPVADHEVAALIRDAEQRRTA